jgi:hypothetical protein
VILADVAIPLHTGVKYVAGAYCVFLALLMIYLTIMARRAARVERELVELNARLAAPDSVPAEPEKETAAS